jgi:hypothetical protein
MYCILTFALNVSVPHNRTQRMITAVSFPTFERGGNAGGCFHIYFINETAGFAFPAPFICEHRLVTGYKN